MEKPGYAAMNFWIWPAYFLFFLMLMFPGIPGLAFVKAVLLGLVLLTIGMATVMDGRFAVHSTVASWTLFFATVGFFFVLRGLFAGTPGASSLVRVYVVWPVIYLVLLGGIASKGILIGLERVLVAATICISIYCILYFLTETDTLPQSIFGGLFPFREEQGVGLYEGHTEIMFTGINSMHFLFPFVVAALASHSSKEGTKLVSRSCLWAASFLGLVIVLLSGRRALLLVTLIAPLLTLTLAFFQPITEKRVTKKWTARLALALVLGLSAGLFVVSPIYDITLAGIADRFSVGFNFDANTTDSGAAARRGQYLALLRGWSEDPLLGAGLGASAYGSIRSELTPWDYEMSYLDLLFQTGLFGFMAYVAGVVWIYWKGTTIIKEGGALGQLMLPALVGMSCFLIASLTNPYLTKFDGLWAIFLPVALINFWLVRRRTRPSAAYRTVSQLG